MNVAELFGYLIATLSAFTMVFLGVLLVDGVLIWWPLWPFFGLGLLVGLALTTRPFKKII